LPETGLRTAAIQACAGTGGEFVDNASRVAGGRATHGLVLAALVSDQAASVSGIAL